ncbi:MAG: hypothetical protein FJ123_10845 [Deltaproteobacteria bacterium]|nr:hypothetical protein [Deltaproteobacteria bacterium]
MRPIEPNIINNLFEALDRQIEVHGGMPLGLVVCGGTALSALGLVMRTTRDVDILGAVLETPHRLTIQRMTEFPEWLVEAANKVGRDFDLPENWFNLGPASQVVLGLPGGLEKRLVRKVYGRYLTIFFISRIDQIHFKLYAAVDQDGYHVQDLFALKPKEAEIEKAAQWTVTQDVSEVFKTLLKDFLEIHHYGDIAKRI